MYSIRLYDSKENGITYQIKKGTKVYIKLQGLNLNLNELNQIEIKNYNIRNGFATLYMHKSLLR